MKFRSDLHAGRAGEHLAAADIMMLGHECFHAAQGMPYDLVADVDGRLLRVQVKTTRKPELLKQRNINNLAYRFWVNRCGKGGLNRYAESEVDLFALVALDTKQVGYLSARDMPKTFFVRPDFNRGAHTDEVVVARNKAIMDGLEAGEDPAVLAEIHGVTSTYVCRVKFGRARSHIAGCYFSDLTLEKAIEPIAANDNE